MRERPRPAGDADTRRPEGEESGGAASAPREGVDDARRRRSPATTTIDGFTYRFVSEGLPSPSVPVNVHVVVDDDDDDDGTRRIFQREGSSPSKSTAADSVDVLGGLGGDGDGPGRVVRREPHLRRGGDRRRRRRLDVRSVGPAGDRKLGHAGPITCRKPTYEVTIVPVSGGGDPGCVVVGATYDAGESCPLDGVGDEALRVRDLSATSASIPATPRRPLRVRRRLCIDGVGSIDVRR